MRRRVILLPATMAVALLLAFAAALAADAQDYQAQVVGGTAVPNGKYRFMTSLQADLSNRPPTKEHFCGGSLIDRDSVLTAAHCVGFIGNETDHNTLSFRRVRIVVGTTVLDSEQGQVRRIARLSDISIHPRWSPRTRIAHDAAVIELSSPVTGIAPIKRATASQNYLERPGRFATVAGWGNTIRQPADGCLIACRSNYPNRMREARVPLVSDRSANKRYDAYFERRSGYIPPIMVAAGKEGKDTCQGDSGGPMFAKTPSGPRQIGITSFGAGCGARGYPGVYTEVNAAPISSFITDAASR